MPYACNVVVLPHYAGPTHAEPLQPAHAGDAGADLYASADVTILPGERAIIPVGLKIALPQVGEEFRFGYEAQVRPRSGAAVRGLGVANAPGTVDSSFRGEIGVIAQNLNPVLSTAVLLKLLTGPVVSTTVAEDEAMLREACENIAKNTIHIQRGERIAQLVFAVYERFEIRVVEELPDSVRGEGGFGSTGR